MDIEQIPDLLENKLNQAEKRIHSLENHAEDLQNRFTFIQEQNTQLSSLCESQKTIIHSKSLEILGLEAKISGYENKIRELEGKILKLAEENKRNLSNLINESSFHDENTMKIAKENDLLKTECEELKASLTIQNKLLENLGQTLESYKENTEKMDSVYKEREEKIYKDLQDLRAKFNEISFENSNLCQTINNLKREIEAKEESLNNKDFDIKNLEFKIKEDELNNYKKELEIKGEFQDLELKFQQKCFENQEMQEKCESLEEKFKDKEKSYEEKIASLDKELQETYQLLEEKKSEITRLYSQFQSGFDRKFDFESLKLPFEIEKEEKILRKSIEHQKNFETIKEQNIRYKVEIDHIKEELTKKMPLLEIRKKEYEEMFNQYSVLKNKLEISLEKNTKLADEIKSQNKQLEEYKKEKVVAIRTTKDLSNQIVVLLYFSDKMGRKIHELCPYFDLSEYLDYQKAINSLNLQHEDLRFFKNIQELQENNEVLLKKLNSSIVQEVPQITNSEIDELKQKITSLQSEKVMDQKLIENLNEKIKKMQNLQDIAALITKQTKDIIPVQVPNKSPLEKQSKFYEHHAKILEENSNFRKELKRLKIDMKKLSFSHENLNNLLQTQEKTARQSLISINQLNEALSQKEAEISKLSAEKQQILEVSSQKSHEIDGQRIKLIEMERKYVFIEDSKKKLESLLKTALEEKMKYFDGFLNAQKEVSSLVIRHKNEIVGLRNEIQRIQQEKSKETQNFLTNENENQMNLLRCKAKIENQEVLLTQFAKRNQLNVQTIAEQNQYILELSKKLSFSNHNVFNSEEGNFSGFVHISQQKNFNLEDLQETLETQKNSYETLIQKITQNLITIEQENVVLHENIRNLELSNEQLQETLNENLLKLQEMQEEKENPQVSNEEMLLLKEEIQSLRKEIEDLNEKNESLVQEKDEIQNFSNQNAENVRKLTEENSGILFELNEIKAKILSQNNLVSLKEILLKEQFELFQKQLDENKRELVEKIEENHALLDKINEKKYDSHMDIEENIEAIATESDIVLELKQKIGQLELKLQEKIKEELLLKKHVIFEENPKSIEKIIDEDKLNEPNENLEEVLQMKENIIIDLTDQITNLHKINEILNEEKDKILQENNSLLNQLKMKEIQIVFSDELKRSSENPLENKESTPENLPEPQLSENEIFMIKEIIKDQKLIELLEKCKKILIYQSLETKI